MLVLFKCFSGKINTNKVEEVIEEPNPEQNSEVNTEANTEMNVETNTDKPVEKTEITFSDNYDALDILLPSVGSLSISLCIWSQYRATRCRITLLFVCRAVIGVMLGFLTFSALDIYNANYIVICCWYNE